MKLQSRNSFGERGQQGCLTRFLRQNMLDAFVVHIHSSKNSEKIDQQGDSHTHLGAMNKLLTSSPRAAAAIQSHQVWIGSHLLTATKAARHSLPRLDPG